MDDLTNTLARHTLKAWQVNNGLSHRMAAQMIGQDLDRYIGFLDGSIPIPSALIRVIGRQVTGLGDPIMDDSNYGPWTPEVKSFKMVYK